MLTRQWLDTGVPGQPGRLALKLWAWSEIGPLCLNILDQKATCFFPKSQEKAALNGLAKLPFSGQSTVSEPAYFHRQLNLLSFKGEPVIALYFNQQRWLYRAREALEKGGIMLLEADIHPPDRYLMERFIGGVMEVKGEWQPRAGYFEATNPGCRGQQQATSVSAESGLWPAFKTVSLDIETAMQGHRLYSIGIVAGTMESTPKDASLESVADTGTIRKVMMVGDSGAVSSLDYLEFYATEKSLMLAFMAWIREYDPDLILGWHVVNFDLRFLQRVADRLRIPFTLGRADSLLEWRSSRQDEEHYTLVIPGRVVLDGVETLKSATFNFQSFSLQNVSRELLGRGKLIQNVDNRGEEITDLFHADKPALAAYNLEDCQLVWDIFVRAQLLPFAVERAQLTGLSMDRFGGSVAAFDHRYLPRLHRAGYVAPRLPLNPQGVGSPGGYVMDSLPGLYENVIVLDFKSLYPSLIRTFKIDPLARILAGDANQGGAQPNQEETPEVDRELNVPGFNGAAFAKQGGILPELIAELWQARDEAKKQSNKALSQAIKIMMNSFYGVLGTPGCRFFDCRLPSSITLRGHQILQQSRDFILAKGYQVIYGDTDSVFVHIQGDYEWTKQKAFSIGEQLAADLNQWWHERIQSEYGLDSFLEIEFETYFLRFVMPTIRGSEKGSKKRYAGLAIDNTGGESIVFKGLESVRTDWTPLARHFQQELYSRIFRGEAYQEYIRDTVHAIRSGQMDTELHYRKRVRRHLEEYIKSIPPHIQAARKANDTYKMRKSTKRFKKGSWIAYVMTVHGPESVELQTGPIDYDLYIERQIAPIADGILQFLDTSYEQIAGDQIELF